MPAEIRRPHCDANRKPWVNGTVLHWFLEDPEPRPNAVRKAFREWKCGVSVSNSRTSAKLFEDRRYAARVRLYWSGESGQTAIMY